MKTVQAFTQSLLSQFSGENLSASKEDALTSSLQHIFARHGIALSAAEVHKLHKIWWFVKDRECVSLKGVLAYMYPDVKLESWNVDMINEAIKQISRLTSVDALRMTSLAGEQRYHTFKLDMDAPPDCDMNTTESISSAVEGVYKHDVNVNVKLMSDPPVTEDGVVLVKPTKKLSPKFTYISAVLPDGSKLILSLGLVRFLVVDGEKDYEELNVYGLIHAQSASDNGQLVLGTQNAEYFPIDSEDRAFAAFQKRLMGQTPELSSSIPRFTYQDLAVADAKFGGADLVK